MSYKDDIQKKYDYGDFALKPKFEDAVLRLEFSNICNDHCLFCPHAKMNRKPCHMEEKFALRIISQAASLGVRKAGYFINNEPFVTEHLAEYIAYSKKAGINYVFVTTNGALATPEKLRAVMDAGLDSLKFSINGGSPETYLCVQGGDDYARVMEHLHYAYEYREKSGCKCQLLTSFVVTKHTQDEIDSHYEKVRPYVDDIVFFNCENLGGQMVEECNALRVEVANDKLPKFKIHHTLPCPLLFNSINITCEGYLTLCCNDATNHLAVADLHEQSLEEAWHGEAMIQARQRHIAGDIEGTQCECCVYNRLAEVKPLDASLYVRSQKRYLAAKTGEVQP